MVGVTEFRKSKRRGFGIYLFTMMYIIFLKLGSSVIYYLFLYELN